MTTPEARKARAKALDQLKVALRAHNTDGAWYAVGRLEAIDDLEMCSPAYPPLTAAQIDEAAAHQAVLDHFSLDEDSDLEATRTVWGTVLINQEAK